jgi:hypothetical protein
MQTLHQSVVILLLAVSSSAVVASVRGQTAAAAKSPRGASVVVTAEDSQRHESLFLLYNLGDMYANYWPMVRGTDPTIFRGWRVSLDMARRKLMIDQLLVRMRSRKIDETIIRLYSDFGQLIDETREAFNQIGQAFLGQRYAIAAREADRFWTSAFVAGFDAYLDHDETGERSIYIGLAEGSRAVFQARGKTEQDFKKIEQQMADRQAQVRAAMDRKKDELVRRSAATADRLASTYGWSRAEAIFGFAPSSFSRPEAAPGDPFPTVREAGRLTTLEGEDPVKAFQDRAQRCFDAVGKVPAGKEYDYFRAVFLSSAGALANLACAKATGRAGFVATKDLSLLAAALGARAWDGYLKYEKVDIDVNYSVRHQIIRSYAFARRNREAVRFIEQAAEDIFRAGNRPGMFPLMMTTPSQQSRGNWAFWYDAACICCLADKDVAGFICLEEAVKLGFKKSADAAIDPDLERLRKKDPRYFAELLGIEKAGIRRTWKYQNLERQDRMRRSRRR